MKKLAFILICSTLLLSGCMRSTVTNQTTADETQLEETMVMGVPTPDMEIHDDIVLDWEQGVSDIDRVLRNTNYYPKMTDVSVFINDENAEITLVMSVQDDTTKEEALDYAQRALEDANNAVADQDFSIAKAEENVTYGGLYERYGVYIGIAPDSTKEDDMTWLVDEHLEKGEAYRALNATE